MRIITCKLKEINFFKGSVKFVKFVQIKCISCFAKLLQQRKKECLPRHGRVREFDCRIPIAIGICPNSLLSNPFKKIQL